MGVVTNWLLDQADNERRQDWSKHRQAAADFFGRPLGEIGEDDVQDYLRAVNEELFWGD